MKKKKKYNVLYVYSGKARPGSGGLDLVVREQIKAFLDEGHSVTFVSRGNYIHPNVKNISFKVTPANLISFLPARYYYNAQHRFFSMIGGFLINFISFDLIVSWTYQSNYLFKIAKKRLIPTLLNCSVAHYKKNKNFNNQSLFIWPQINFKYLEEEYQLSDQILVASDFAKLSFLENSISNDKIFSIGRGADVEKFSFLTLNSKKFRVVFFGRASERKGVLQALDAWKLASIKNGEFLIIGHIPKELKEEIFLRVALNVRILGHLNNPENFLKKCSIQLLPSRLEGMAKSLIEGAACGLITLSTLEAGFPILDGETGYYINRDNVKDISDKIKFLYKHPKKMDVMRKKSREFVMKNYTWPMFRIRFINAVEKSLK